MAISGQSCNGLLWTITQKLAGSVPSPFVGVFPCYPVMCPGLTGALEMAEKALRDKTARWSPVILNKPCNGFLWTTTRNGWSFSATGSGRDVPLLPSDVPRPTASPGARAQRSH
jgi:hypothetical protein